MFNLQNFKANLQSVGRTAHFEVSVSLPAFLAAKYKRTDLSIRAMATNIPGVNIETIQTRRASTNTIESFPINKSFGDLGITFICDAEGETLSLFEDWIDFIFPTPNEYTQKKHRVAYRNDYVSPTISISCFDVHGKKRIEYIFTNSYPLRKNDVNLNWGSLDDMMVLNVDFKYTSYQKRVISNPDKPLGTTEIATRNNLPVTPNT